MSDDRPTDQDFKTQQKERARLARRAAYEKQKAYIKEKKEQVKADPAYKKMQQERRAEQREKYKQLKARHQKVSVKPAVPAETADERKIKDHAVLSTLTTGVDINVESESLGSKPYLRLVKLED